MRSREGAKTKLPQGDASSKPLDTRSKAAIKQTPVLKTWPEGTPLSKVGIKRGGRPLGVKDPVDRDLVEERTRIITDQPWRYLPHTMAMHLSDGKWLPYSYLMFISHLIATVIAQGGGRIIVEIPPRHGKSLFISQWLPVWFLSNWPDKYVLLSTYEANFAASWGRKVRNIIAKHDDELGVYVSSDSAAAAYWATTAGGGMMTAGVGGPITGKGGNLCFPAGTMVMTSEGNIDISRLSACNFSPLVLSYDHDSGTLVWRKIIATKESEYDGDIAEFETHCGHKIRPTWEHHVYDCERGYKEAGCFVPGDRVLSLPLQIEQDLSGLREVQEGSGNGLSSVLSEGPKGRDCSQMCPVWKDIRETEIRIREGAQEGMCRFLLRPGMQSEASRGEAQQALSCVRREYEKQEREILFTGMPQKGSGCCPAHGPMSSMPKNVSPGIQPESVLFDGLQECCTFGHDEGGWQFPLQGRDQLQQVVPRDAKVDFGAGRRCVCGMHETEFPKTNRPFPGSVANGSFDSPHRFESTKQRSDKSGCPMFDLPCETHGIQRDTVSVVRRLRSGKIKVYDIQVEGTGNFFANGVLVSNCLIDDPHKNWQEAMSPTICHGIQDWFDSTFYTRLEPGGTLVVLHTRWTQNDLIGYCLDQHPEENWIVVRFPAFAEEEDILGRKPGQALCPERYDEAALKKIQTVLGSQMWNGLYQQRPSAIEGEIWKRERWRYYQVDPVCSFVIQSWDTGFKKSDKTRTSYSVCQTWGVFPQGYCLLAQWRGRVEYPELEKMARAQYKTWRPNAVLIEDKGSGQSLIQSLQRDTELRMPIIPVDPQDDGNKVMRAIGVTPLQESGLLWLPGFSQDEVWVSEMVERFTIFPNGNFMDEIDTTSQALSYLRDHCSMGEIYSAMARITATKLSGFRKPFGGSLLRL